jgi:hypothetical protein
MKEANVSEVAPVEMAPVEEQQALTISQGGAVGRAMPPAEIKPAITPAQAKVDAIASLTMSAYAKAGTLVLTPDEVSKMQAEFPDEAFKPGAAGKENLIYIEHAFLRDRLNQAIGTCQWSIVPRNRWAEEFTIPARTGKPEVHGTRVYVEAMLIIRGAFVAEAVGDMDYYPKNNQQNYGDAVEGAKTAALRRCCKEIGIGLQAWKKDWCEGWWKRRTGKGDPARNQFQRATPATAATAKPPATQAPPAKPPGPPLPTVANRQWLITKIGPEGKAAAEAYFRSIEPNPWLMPNEGLEDLELRFVPATMPRFNALVTKLTLFATEHKAERPYEPDTRMDVAPAKAPARTAAKLTGNDAKGPEQPPTKQDPDWFWDIICTVPHKGQKRDDYMASPDTVRSLYAATKAGDKDAQSRLWGFANHWNPEPRTVGNKTYQPTAADHKFREALDAFLDWHEKHENDTDPDAKTLKDPEPGDPNPEEEDDVPF